MPQTKKKASIGAVGCLKIQVSKHGVVSSLNNNGINCLWITTNWCGLSAINSLIYTAASFSSHHGKPLIVNSKAGMVWGDFSRMQVLQVNVLNEYCIKCCLILLETIKQSQNIKKLTFWKGLISRPCFKPKAGILLAIIYTGNGIQDRSADEHTSIWSHLENSLSHIYYLLL